MSPKLNAVLCLFLLDLAVLVVVVGTCYAWLRATHIPLRVYEQKMLCYAVLLIASCPILGPLFVASVYWLMPVTPSVIFVIALFLLWGVASFSLMQRHYRPRGFMNGEHP
jgi:membrane-associated HD superfamily phosphohydrolase